MVSRARLAIVLIIVVCGVGACIEQQTPIAVLPMVTGMPPSSALTPTTTPLIQGITPGGTLPAEAGTSAAVGVDPAPYVQKATEELAKALNISPSSVKMVGIPLPVQWEDSSLGCPLEGQTYAPVVTPGYLIILEAGGNTYKIHTDLGDVVIICTNPTKDLGNMTVPDPIVAEFISEVKEDLASRLNVSVESVVVVSSEAVDWPDSSLGCPKAGEDYDQVLVPGYRIVLAVEDRYYEYHTDVHRWKFCELPTPTP
ncbi:MAG: hypothetical protein JXB30_18640 [Anaerolineae bacterium]|nr:hypothetical protein [Anaerolineae bacterium]